MEISDVLKLVTAWMDGWEALEKGSFASEWGNRYTAARYFLRNLVHVKNSNLDNRPVLTLHQLMEPEARHCME
eukprot:15435858-Alexandrium_andersonii.AAC.1